MTQQGFYAPERILVIVAHADDIEFGTAGTVARWTECGSTVTYCIITDNAAGSNEPGADLAALAETRRQEQLAAAEAVGVTDVRFLGYPDGTLQPTLELRRDLTRLIREIRPQIVVAMDPSTIFVETENYINHPDHRAAGEAAVYAVFPSAGTRPIFPELLEEGYEPHDVSKLYLTLSTKPNLFVDITEVKERKYEALRRHKSQLNEDVVTMVRGWDAETGKRFSVPAAESFRVITLRDDQQNAPQEAPTGEGA